MKQVPSYYRPLPTDRKVNRGWWKLRNAPIHIGVQMGYIATAALYGKDGYITHSYALGYGNTEIRDDPS